jgi:N-acetylglutamate synthase-like GNAT family acetyltransferase
VRVVYLLTENADGFFTRFGVRRMQRAVVPSRVKQSVEFTRACPVTTRAMALDVRAEDSR